MPRIAVLADIHFSPDPPPAGSRRQSDLGAVLLQRAVWRLNQAIRPDVTVVLGDLLNLQPGQSAPDQLRRLQAILRQLESPCLVIPGNHDGPESDFAGVFGRPPEWADLAGIRFLPFLDAEEPGYNARRSAADLARFARARGDWAGPLVSLQHVPLVPPGMTPTIYRLTNDAETVAALRAAGVSLALSGHYHPGLEPVSDGHAHYAAAPALCEEPFAFLEVRLEPGSCDVVRHELALPAGLGLVDGHAHTSYAYCSENMDVPAAVRLAKLFRLGGLAITEHADHLYVSGDQLRRQEHLVRELRELAGSPASRMARYWADAKAWRSDFVRVGLEMPSNYLGGTIADPADLARCDLIVGAVHHLRELECARPDPGRAFEEYRGMVRVLLRAGARVLAHPFRVFRWSRSKLEPPAALLDDVVGLLKEHGAAAELNSHKNEPIPAFVERCLDRGVPLTLGSDAHNLAEVGYLFPQLDLLRRLGAEVKTG